MKGCVIFFLDFRYNFPNIFNIISKSFATYGCCHPCYFLFNLILFWFFLLSIQSINWICLNSFTFYLMCNVILFSWFSYSGQMYSHAGGEMKQKYSFHLSLDWNNEIIVYTKLNQICVNSYIVSLSFLFLVLWNTINQ